MTKKSKDIFICHSSKDKKFADQLVRDLMRRNISVWYDKLDITLGDSIPLKINEALASVKYFMIILSPNALKSKWVKEELNAALMKQVISEGTFILPILLEDCEIPPLLKHRHYADFRLEYDSALNDILNLWQRDNEIANINSSMKLYPWPDLETSDNEFIYLHSTRFDKFFRMSCDYEWTANFTIDYIIHTLSLPWDKELLELGMRWSFSYRLIFQESSIPLSKTLKEAGIAKGSIVKLGINGIYEDLFEKELKDLWDKPKLYEITANFNPEREIKIKISKRGKLTRERLREIASTCFSHV